MATLKGTAFLVFLLACSLIAPVVSSKVTIATSVQSTGSIVYNTGLLHASGVNLVDASVNLVKLKGAQVDYNERMKGYFGLDDVQRIKSSGGNIVELHAIRFESLMTSRNVINTAFFTNYIDVWVSWCTQTQVYCIINLQDFGYSYSFGLGFPSWMLDGHGYGTAPYSASTNDQAFIDFWNLSSSLHEDNRQSVIYLWQYIANRYKSNPYVMFGIMNEPLCGIPLTVSQSLYISGTYATFMGQVVDAIREVGANQLVFIDRPYTCSVGNWYDNLQPVNRADIVWEDHCYVSEGWPLSEWEYIVNDGMVQKFMTEFKKPLYIGEYGIYPNPNMQGWQNILSDEVAFMKSKQTAGYSWHHWGFLAGECDPNFNQQESNYIVQTIFG